MWAVWWNSRDGTVCIWLCESCGFCGIACGLPVHFRWPANTWLRKGVLEAQDGVAVSVVWPLPSSLASGPWRILNEHIRP